MGDQFGGVPVIANPDAPDVFADEALSFDTTNSTVRISFGVAKMAEPTPPSAMQFVVIGRLILPIESAQRLALGLYDYLKKQGHDPAAVAGSPGSVQ